MIDLWKPSQFSIRCEDENKDEMIQKPWLYIKACVFETTPKKLSEVNTIINKLLLCQNWRKFPCAKKELRQFNGDCNQQHYKLNELVY